MLHVHHSYFSLAFPSALSLTQYRVVQDSFLLKGDTAAFYTLRLIQRLSASALLPTAPDHDEWYAQDGPLPADPPTASVSAFGVGALLRALSPPPGSLAPHPDPPGLGLPLFGYQREALGWCASVPQSCFFFHDFASSSRMLSKERGTGVRALLSPLWGAWRCPGGQLLYVNSITGTVSLHKPLAPAQPLLRGGILADAMGLGKTAMLAALILANPFDATVPDTSANGTSMEGHSKPPTRVKATLVVLTASILHQVRWDHLLLFVKNFNHR